MNEFSKPFGLKKGGKKFSKTDPIDEKPIAGKKIPKWKIQSMQFRQAMTATTGNDSTSGAKATGGFNPS